MNSNEQLLSLKRKVRNQTFENLIGLMDDHDFEKTGMSALQFIIERRMVKLHVPRGAGKTEFLKTLATDNSLFFVHNHYAAADLIKQGVPGSITTATHPSQRPEAWKYGLDFSNADYVIGDEISKENIREIVTYFAARKWFPKFVFFSTNWID